jgi:A/G-specific adenine glycosylase
VILKRRPVLNFAEILLKWNKEKNRRQMPWKGEKDPYKIWLSEIILQQTRVEQGLNYYQKFISSFPNVHSLANASQKKVYKLWEGLGYYSRCANLMETAKHISKNLKGSFPNEYEEIKKLKGVGPYTAAAIASFAFNKAHAVLDGNVFRVLSRIYSIEEPIDSTEGKKLFFELANELLDRKNPGSYNQAIMDFGATICKPIPECQYCPFKKYCKAFLSKRVLSFPVKIKKVAVQKRFFNYVIIEYNGRFAIRQRTEKDIWRNLFEFLLIESQRELNKEAILKNIKAMDGFRKVKFETQSISEKFSQRLSHQLIQGKFIYLKFWEKPKVSNVLWVRKNEIKKYAFSKFINQYLLKQSETSKDDL